MRTIFISGASAGFGLEAVKKFIHHGDKVIGLARRQDRLNELREELGENFYPLPCDIANRDALEKAVTSLPKEWQMIDILVNNAGLALGQEAAYETNYDDWETMIDINIKGLTHLTHLLLPKMVEKGIGTIINLSSTAGSYPYFGANVYGSSKAFVKHFSLNLRADLVGKNIRVTSIEPGLCSETEFSYIRYKGDDKKAENTYADVAAITGEDVAETIFWVANLPQHININRIEMMPTAQTFAGLTVHKGAFE